MLKEACALKHKGWAIPRSFLAIVCAVLMIVFSGQIFAQAGIDMGSVTRAVKDASGAMVQGAQCTLTNISTNVSLKAISTSAGDYAFPLVPVGTNDYLNKRSQLLHSPSPLPNRPGMFKENSGGGIIGGPVVIPHVYDGRNKTFFTFDMQYTYYRDAPSVTGTLPSATMQNSNFTNMVDFLTMNTNAKTDDLRATASLRIRPLIAV